jgi:hypothetical protein
VIWTRVSFFALAASLIAAAACHQDIVFNELAAAPCKADPDCILPSMHCNAGQCVACTTDAHCTAPGFTRCDPTLHRCVECSASMPADCGGSAVCRTNRCMTTCVAGCPASTVCDDMVCAQCDDGRGCGGSAAGPFCFEHVCGACLNDTNCSGATPRCDPVTHDCVECQANADCPAARPLCDVGVGTCVPLP